MTSPVYLDRFRQILREHGWHTDVSPAALLERWSALVDAAAQGYRWTLDEYLNELSARDLLEALFTDAEVGSNSEVDELKGRVLRVDDRLRAVLLDDVQVGNPGEAWWRRGVLRFAGSDYAHDVESIYGISIETA